VGLKGSGLLPLGNSPAQVRGSLHHCEGLETNQASDIFCTCCSTPEGLNPTCSLIKCAP
jgi:hypothetical protein